MFYKLATATTCCCIPRGETSFKVNFEKNAYVLGEDANMFCDIDNSDCSVNINHIEAKLINRVILKDKSSQKHVISKTLISKKFEGVESGEVLLFI